MKKLLLVAVLFAAVGALAKDTVVYYTSDTHGFFYPRNGRGGFATLANLIKQGPYPYLLLDGGDFADGSAEAIASRGEKGIQMMNAMGYHAATLGNHEFILGVNRVEELIRQANFDILAANFRHPNPAEQLTSRVLLYKIFTINGVSIAVIGIANRSATRNMPTYFFISAMDALRSSLAQKAVRQAQVVIVLAHDSVTQDLPNSPFYVGEIGRRFSGQVHLVLGGHAHRVVPGEYIGNVLFVEPGQYLESVAKVVLHTDDKTGKFISASCEIIPLLVAKFGREEHIAAYAESLKIPGLEEVWGTAAEPLTLDMMPVGAEQDSSVRNWVADVIRSQTETDVSIYPSLMVRMGLLEGPIRQRDLLGVLPDDREVAVLEVKGIWLREFIHKALFRRRSFSCSGLQVNYRHDSAKRLIYADILVQGKALQDDKIYKVATVTNLAGGLSREENFTTDLSGNLLHSNQTVLKLLKKALKQGPVQAPHTGRIVCLDRYFQPSNL